MRDAAQEGAGGRDTAASARAPWFAGLRRFLRGFLIWRVQRFGGDFGLYATRWFYLSNHGYVGAPRYFVRVVEWRKAFGRPWIPDDWIANGEQFDGHACEDFAGASHDYELGRDTSAAGVDGAESPAGPRGHHEPVGERQGRQPAQEPSSALGWHVISGEDLLRMFKRVAEGETPSLVYAEEYANARREQVDP